MGAYGYGSFTKKQAQDELEAIRDPNYRAWAGHPYGHVDPAFLAFLKKTAGETGGARKSGKRSSARGHCRICKGPHVYKHGKA